MGRTGIVAALLFLFSPVRGASGWVRAVIGMLTLAGVTLAAVSWEEWLPPSWAGRAAIAFFVFGILTLSVHAIRRLLKALDSKHTEIYLPTEQRRRVNRIKSDAGRIYTAITGGDLEQEVEVRSLLKEIKKNAGALAEHIALSSAALNYCSISETFANVSFGLKKAEVEGRDNPGARDMVKILLESMASSYAGLVEISNQILSSYPPDRRN